MTKLLPRCVLHLARRFGRFVEFALLLVFFKTHAELTL